MINYTEKGYGLHKAIAAAGHKLTQIDGVWSSSDDVAVQAIINSYDDLPDAKTAKIDTIKAEALTRIAVLFPAITSVDEVTFYAEFWLSIKATSRAPTAPFQKVIDIYSAAKTAIASVNSATTKSGVEAVVVAWPV